MKNIETLYNQTEWNLEGTENPKALIEDMRRYLACIRPIPKEHTEEALAGRKRYTGDETGQLLSAIVSSFGDRYPTEVIGLMAEQEYTVHHAVCKSMNLFAYLSRHIDTIKASRSLPFVQLLDFAYRNNTPELFGKKVFQSHGNGKDYYHGFLNECSSRLLLEEHVRLRFGLSLDTKNYNMLSLGRRFGVSFETLSALEVINSRADFLYGSDNHGEVFPRADEVVFRALFKQFVHEMKEGFLSYAPGYELSVETFFENRSDINTNYFIRIEKDVTIHADYDQLQQELINTIRSFNQLEDTYFGVDSMKETWSNFFREKRTKEFAKPLFA